MDRALLERMVGAIALVLLLVIGAPALLDGSSESGFDKFANHPDDKEVSTRVIVLNEPQVAKTSDDPAPNIAVEAPKIIAPIRPVPAAKPAASVPRPVADSGAPASAPNPAATPAPVAKQPTVAPPPVAVAGKSQAVSEQQDSAVPDTDKGTAATGFAVQLGSFGQVENAQKYASQLSDRGFAVFVRSGGSAAVHRVYAGPRSTRDAAEKLAVVLGDAGYKGIVVDLSSNSGNGGR
jgi:cell division septation protein DedD